MNDNLFLFRSFYHRAIFAVVLALISSLVFADTAPPPVAPSVVHTVPSNGTFANAGNNSGITFTTKHGLTYTNTGGFHGTLTGHFKGGSTNNNATIMHKSNPVTMTDNYGNTVRGQTHTTTTMPSSNYINNMATGLMGAAIAGNIINSPNATTAAEELGRGNYGAAAANAAAAMDWTGIGHGVNGLMDAFNRGKQGDTMHDAAKAAAEQKAQQAAAAAQAAAQAAESNGFGDYLPDATGKPAKYPKLLVWSGVSSGSFILPDSFGSLSGATITGQAKIDRLGITIGLPNPCSSGCNLSYKTVIVNKDNYHQYENDIRNAVNNQSPKPTIEDFFLTQQELMTVIVDYLNKHLQQNEELLTAITNMLWANGQLNDKNTQTVVTGNQADNTFVTAPYTPVGTNQAQQTSFIVNPDGSVTVSSIPRPDLGAHTSVAPTRSPVGGGTGGTGSISNPPTTTITPTTPTNPKKPDADITIDVEICDDDDKGRVVCLPAGSDDYTDLQVPKDEIKLQFEKKDYFNDDAQCPSSPTFVFLGASYQLSYAPMCKIAILVSPMVELVGIVFAMSIAYAAVREL